MTDNFGREITYLRLSVTQRCQQRCVYCTKDEGGCIKQRELSTSDFILIIRAAALCGIKKLRITGGEPLLRNDLADIIDAAAQTGKFEDIALTTNAQLLALRADELKKAGLKRVNISLDSLVPEKYAALTGSGDINSVFEGIRAAFKYGLTPVKLNTVLVRGVNDAEAESFAALAREYPIDIRFIELMPMGEGGARGVATAQLLKRLAELEPVGGDTHAAAKMYTGKGYKGRVGFISPMSGAFCAQCTRLRITADGFIRPCLARNDEYSLRAALDTGDVQAICTELERAVSLKPAHGGFAEAFETNRGMNRIGG